jgi:hypothetical protein
MPSKEQVSSGIGLQSVEQGLVTTGGLDRFSRVPLLGEAIALVAPEQLVSPLTRKDDSRSEGRYRLRDKPLRRAAWATDRSTRCGQQTRPRLHVSISGDAHFMESKVQLLRDLSCMGALVEGRGSVLKEADGGEIDRSPDMCQPTHHARTIKAT